MTTSSPQNGVGGGTITYSNGLLKFTLNGASPNTVYTTNETSGVNLYSSQTYDLTTFTTNAQGDGSSSISLESAGEGGDLFEVVPNKSGATTFIGGFSVPN